MVILSLFWSNERFYRITWVGRETLKPVLSNSPTVNRDIHSLIRDSVVPVAKLWKKFNTSGESAVKAGWFYRCHSRYWGSHGGLLSCSFIQPISQVAMEKSEKVFRHLRHSFMLASSCCQCDFSNRRKLQQVVSKLLGEGLSKSSDLMTFAWKQLCTVL